MLKDTTLGARGYRITTVWAYSADDKKKKKKKKKKIVICFITKKTGFDISCNGDNLHEMQILFSWKNDRNISKYLLNFTQNVKRYGLQKQIAHGSVHGKTYNLYEETN